MLELRRLGRIGNWTNTAIASWNVKVARWVSEMKETATCLTRLEQHLLAMLIALGTDVMGRFAVAHAFLQRVDGGNFKYRDKLIARFFARPVFKLHDLFFKIVFFAQQRSILLLYGRDQGVRINDCFLKLYELGVALCFVGSGSNVSAGLSKAGDCSEECGEGIGYSSSNVELSGLRGCLRRSARTQG